MIITRAPLRITLGGGGTDVPAYYRKHGGLCLAAAIDKYVYIAIHRRFDDRLVVKYSEIENVAHASELKHPIIREAMAMLELDGKGMEIVSFADIPAGTGLGSSGSFTVALLQALYAWTGEKRLAREIANDACEVELDRLKSPIGKQDQWISAVGGLARLEFMEYSLRVNQMLPPSALDEQLMLFFTDYSRSASDILAAGHKALSMADHEHVTALHDTKANAALAYEAIIKGRYASLGILFNDHWQRKRWRAGMSNPAIDAMYEHAMQNGALGGKLVGAGGGGFFLFVVGEREPFRIAMQAKGYREVPFHFDYEGVKVLTQ